MNRYISIGFSIIIGPTILLAFGNFTQSLDLVVVSEWTLFNLATPIGGILIILGLFATANKQIKAFLTPNKISLPWLFSEFLFWIVSITIIYKVIAQSFKLTAFYLSEQSILDIVIDLQVIVGAALIRFLIAFLRTNLRKGLVKKIGITVFIAALFFGLTLYSDMLSHRWWQGYKNGPTNLRELLNP
jgi:uncharacterized membrane protein YgdD (TMEM256/DUF423 family)